MRNNAQRTTVIVLVSMLVILAIALGDANKLFGDPTPSPTSEPTQPEAQPNEQAYPLPLPTTPTCKPPDGSEQQPFDKTSIDMLNTDTGEVETIWAFILRDGQAAFKMPEGGVVIMDPGHSLTIEAGGSFLVLYIGCDKHLWIGEYDQPPPDLVPEEGRQG